jgi:hypothetical protein
MRQPGRLHSASLKRNVTCACATIGTLYVSPSGLISAYVGSHSVGLPQGGAGVRRGECGPELNAVAALDRCPELANSTLQSPFARAWASFCSDLSLRDGVIAPGSCLEAVIEATTCIWADGSADTAIRTAGDVVRSYFVDGLTHVHCGGSDNTNIDGEQDCGGVVESLAVAVADGIVAAAGGTGSRRSRAEGGGRKVEGPSSPGTGTRGLSRTTNETVRSVP